MWICKKVYNVETTEDENGNSYEVRGDFSHYSIGPYTSNGGLPRGGSLAYEYVLVPGVRTRWPMIITDLQGVTSIVENAGKKATEELEEKYLKRINTAPRVKAKLAMLMDGANNDPNQDTFELAQFQLLLDNGSWGTLVKSIPSNTTLPDSVKEIMLDFLNSYLSNE